MSNYNTTAYWEEQKRGRIRPQAKVGTVVINTIIDEDMVAEGLSTPRPLYKHAPGIYRDYADSVREGDLVYRYNNREIPDGAGLANPYGESNDNTTVGCLSVLNGQGSELESEAVLESKITIVGIADTNRIGAKKRFTTGVGGIKTTTNNGPYFIRTGDCIIGRPPTKQQIKDSAPGVEGGDGLVRLQYHPYSPKLHKTQPKEIWACLQDKEHKIDYLPAYREHCRQLLDSHMASAMVAIVTEWKDISKIMSDNTVTTDKKALALLGLFGHSALPRTEINNAIAERLFVPFSASKLNKLPYIAKTENADNIQIMVNRIQEECMGQTIESTAYFIRLLTNLIVGNAVSNARPGEDFSIQQTSYCK